MAATLLNIADLAARLDTDARTTRKFLRSITPADEQPGKGKRWAVPAAKVRTLQSQFKKYTDEHAPVDEHENIDDTLPADEVQDMKSDD